MPISIANGIVNGDLCDFAWCAGFFDGEGSTTASLNKTYYHFYLKVPQKDPILLYRFQRIIGGYGKVYYDSKRDLHQLEVGKFEHIQYIICLMWRWLGSYKREQYKRALALKMLTKRNPPKYDSRSIYRREIAKFGSAYARDKAKFNALPKNNKPFINPFEVQNAIIDN